MYYVWRQAKDDQPSLPPTHKLRRSKKAPAGKAGSVSADRMTARQHDFLMIFQLSEPFQVFCRFDKQPLNGQSMFYIRDNYL